MLCKTELNFQKRKEEKAIAQGWERERTPGKKEVNQ